MEITKLRINSVKVLRFILENSKSVRFHGKTWYVVNSNEFEKQEGSSRQVFRTIKTSLEVRQMIIQVHIKNRDAEKTKPRKYYTITPLGLMYLAKNESEVEFEEEMYTVHEKIFHILETFLVNYRMRYTSKIMKKDTDFSRLSRILESLIPLETLHELLHQRLTQLDETEGTFTTGGSFVYSVELSLDYDAKIPVCVMDIYEENVEVEENTKERNRLLLKTDPKNPQFHHYVATILVTSLIYTYVKNTLIIDNDRLFMLKRKDKHIFEINEEIDFPQYAIDIFLAWNNIINKNVENIAEENQMIQNKLSEVMQTA